MTPNEQSEELREYFQETIARYTNSPAIPELAGILARYVTNLLPPHTDDIDSLLDAQEDIAKSQLEERNSTGIRQYNRFELRAAIAQHTKEAVLKGRLVELDLLEQAINTGWDMNKYKLYRLEKLEAELAPSPQQGGQKDE